jgi:putative acetyltransferase
MGPVERVPDESEHRAGLIQDGVHPVGSDESDRLLEVWEAAVRATHHFLSESDIDFFRPLVRQGLRELPHLLCVRDAAGSPVAFVGVGGDKMEALFVHPSWHRLGIGRRLARHAVVELGATTVDVNEQNEAAVAFYRRLGYVVEGRSAVDGTGKPFPVLHMRLDDAARMAITEQGLTAGDRMEQDVIDVAHAWDRAMVENDADAIGRFMADEWTIVGSDGGVMDKGSFLGLVRSGVLSHDVMESHDMKVRLYGDTAVVVARGVSGGRYQGRAFREVERVSCVYVRSAQQWRCVLTHLSRMSGAG